MKKFILITLIQISILSSAFSQLYWTEGENGKIRSSHSDGGSVTTIISRLEYPSGIAIDSLNKKIYWSDRGGFDGGRAPIKIQRANLDGSNIEDIITTGLIDPFGLAIDPAGNKLYWVDAMTNKVECSNLNGDNRKVLVNEGLGDPEGIVIDLANKKLYWTNFVSGDIQCSNLDGSNIVTLYSSAGSLEGLALDFKSGDMYVADYNGSILKAKIDGSEITTLVSGLNKPIAVALDLAKGKLYWAEKGDDRIKRSDLDGRNIENVKRVKAPIGITLVLK